MATVVSITNPITGAVEQVDKLDHTAQQIDDAVALVPQLSNPNLLDNWYFANPVNQRGQTEYASSNDTSESYGIDRWKQTGTLAVNEGCVAVSNTKVPILRQRLENPNIYRGKTLTFSVQVKSALSNLVLHIRYNNFVNAAVKGFTNIPAGGVISVTAVIPDVDLTALFVQCSSESVKEFALVAAKLELGSQQTLAHQDADGNWVLNEIPDYGEQLARCQRHLFVPTTQTDSIYSLAIGVGTSTTTITFFLPLPTTMRAKSSITFSGLYAANEVNSMLTITKVANYGQVANGVWLHTTVASGAEVGKAYYLRTSNPWSLVLDANL